MVILGIDPAWTPRGPSGVALLARKQEEGQWRCVGLAPSYDSFLALAEGKPVDWRTKPTAGVPPEPRHLLEVASLLAAEEQITLVTIDMPIATVPFDSRRKADNLCSSKFGSQGCAVHSPSKDRPGTLGTELSEGFVKAGFSIATAAIVPRSSRCLVEVYPHPAVLVLLGEDYRIPYKCSNSRKYWPDVGTGQRVRNLLRVYSRIHGALQRVILETSLDLPEPDEVPSLAYLKRYEDVLDALVCGWIGIEYLAGNAMPYGDQTAAIWVPKSLSV